MEGYIAQLDGPLDIPRRGPPAADLGGEGLEPLLVGQVGAVPPREFAPPAGLLDEAQFGVRGLAAFGSLREQGAVLVRFEIAPDFVDGDDQERGGFPQAVHGSDVAVDFERAQAPDEGACDGVEDCDQEEG